jgi:hypothetical protein
MNSSVPAHLPDTSLFTSHAFTATTNRIGIFGFKN